MSSKVMTAKSQWTGKSHLLQKHKKASIVILSHWCSLFEQIRPDWMEYGNLSNAYTLNNLCYAIDFIEQNLHTQICHGDSVQSTTFCGDHIVELLFCSMTHYDIIIGNDVARDVNCDTIMSHDFVCAYHDVIMNTDIVLFVKSLNFTLNINIINTEVVWHKNKKQFVMYPCLEIRFFCVAGIFHVIIICSIIYIAYLFWSQWWYIFSATNTYQGEICKFMNTKCYLQRRAINIWGNISFFWRILHRIRR